jgi:hypothetical protein
MRESVRGRTAWPPTDLASVETRILHYDTHDTFNPPAAPTDLASVEARILHYWRSPDEPRD